VTLCNATAKRTGKQCGAQAIRGREKCRVHGGTTPRGLFSPHTKTGMRSKALPERMTERYQAALKDEQRLFNLLDGAALMEARINDLLTRVDTGESGVLWAKVEKAWQIYKSSVTKGDPGEIAVARTIMDHLIEDGRTDFAAWAEIMNLIKEQAKIATMERKSRIEEKRIITIEEAMTAQLALIESVKANVTDPKALEAIQRDFLRITNQPDRQPIDGLARVVGSS
jgi:hypothetical protein